MIIEKEQTRKDGGVAQLGEHLPCKQGVMGSNPIISTSQQKLTKNDGANQLPNEQENGL